MSKKGLSPVVATALLIALVVILAVIIFLWARAFLPEKLTKDIGGGDVTVEEACGEVVMRAEYDSDSVAVLNDGNVPLYGVEIGIKKGAFGSLEYLNGEFTGGVSITKPGESNIFGISESLSESGISIESGDEIVVVPVVLGLAESGERKEFACDVENSQTISVS